MSQVSELGKVVTANRLSDGAVVFLAENGCWSETIDSALLAPDAEATDALSRQGQQAESVNHVTGSYLIEVERRGGRVHPLHIRERIRALGPTVSYAGSQEARHVSL